VGTPVPFGVLACIFRVEGTGVPSGPGTFTDVSDITLNLVVAIP
jgi:hypothetical protein